MSFETLAAGVRNWGRWGAEDQLGALNLVTPERVAHALTLPRKGKVLSLSLGFDENGVWSGGGLRHNPIHVMNLDAGDAVVFEGLAPGSPERDVYPPRWQLSRTRWNDDSIFMPLQASTQWDALSHVHIDGTYYNGVPAGVVGSKGALRLGIEHAAVHGVVGRGVLLDIPRHRGLAHLPAREAVEPEELEAVARAQGVDVGSGDILLVRTGWLAARDEWDAVAGWRSNCPGLHWRTAGWLHDRDVAALAADNVAVEPSGSEIEGVSLPLHVLCLHAMGVMLGELWNFEELARECADDGRYECLLVAPPLRVTRAVGAPLNPIAIV